MIYHHRDGAQARSSPPRGRGTLGQRYEDDSLSFVAIKKVSSPLARIPTREGSGAQSAFRMLDIARARMDNMHGALEQKHKGVLMMALVPEPEVLNKEPELAAIVAAPGGAPSRPISSMRSDTAAIVTAPGGASSCSRLSSPSDKVAELEVLNKDPAPSSTLPAPGGAANLALAMAMAMVLTAAARQAKQLGNPSCLVSKVAAASSLSKTGTAPSAVAGNRYGDARGAARALAHAGTRGAGTRRLARQGRRDQRRQGGKRTGKAAGPRPVLVSGGGRRGPLAGAGRPTDGNPLRPGARACWLGGLEAWGMRPTSSVGVSFRALHLTGSGRLWMARFRLLLLRSGGQVGRRGRRG